MGHAPFLAILGAVIGALLVTTAPAEAAGRSGAVQNAGGGATVGSVAVRQGPNGGRAARAGKTVVNADGSAAHRSGFVAEGAKGSVQSSGAATRDASGNVTQSRTTTATGSTTGNSTTSSSSYNPATGRSRTTTCFDATGTTIACPSRP